MRNSSSPVEPLAIGIEIGGTKLQVGIGSTDGKLLKGGVLRRQAVPENGADGIRHELIAMVDELLASKGLDLTNICKVGIGFGGLLDTKTGITLKSYQVEGWDNFPLKEWAQAQWGKPVHLQNDASVAGLAEALHGNGRGHKRIFYMTLGSGIGGGWILDGEIDDGQGYGAAEVGHTWVSDPDNGNMVELEQVCSGWAIGRRAQKAALGTKTLMTELVSTLDQIDAKVVYEAAEHGDPLAKRILDETCQTLGLAIGNVIALLHPERVILGGGVSLMGYLFWDKLKGEVQSRTIPNFAGTVDLVRAKLKQDVVVIGALCLE